MFSRVRDLLQPDPPPASAVWSLRVALFSVGLLICGVLLHRLFSLPTPVMLNLIKLSILCAVLSILLISMAAVRIWRTGCQGSATLILAGLISLALLTWPLAQMRKLNTLPEINDVTTDPDNAPMFDTLAKARAPDANTVTYAGERFAAKQREAYPDLQSLWVNRSSAEAYEIAQEALTRQGLRVVTATPPGQSLDRPGRIEAVDRTMVMGFYDDVVVRVIGNTQSARIDLRSASRYGRHDLGRNARRLRRLMVEINARLEATVSAQAT